MTTAATAHCLDDLTPHQGIEPPSLLAKLGGEPGGGEAPLTAWEAKARNEAGIIRSVIGALSEESVLLPDLELELPEGGRASRNEVSTWDKGNTWEREQGI